MEVALTRVIDWNTCCCHRIFDLMSEIEKFVLFGWHGVHVDLLTVVIEIAGKGIVVHIEGGPFHVVKSVSDSILLFLCVTAEVEQTRVKSIDRVIQAHHRTLA